MKKHKGKSHTGKIHHKDMTHVLDGVGGRDPHAHASHHAANSAHGMPEGMAPQGHFDDGGEGETEGLHGGNCEECG